MKLNTRQVALKIIEHCIADVEGGTAEYLLGIEDSLDTTKRNYLNGKQSAIKRLDHLRKVLTE